MLFNILFLLVGFFLAGIFVVDKWSQIKEKVSRTVYKFTKPKIPNKMTDKIINSLQKGGHTIYIRHSPKDNIVNIDAHDYLSLDKEIQIPPAFFKGGCLNFKGKTEAWLIGEIFKKLNIPVGVIYASPTCRTMETAELAFGHVDVVEKFLYAGTFVRGSKESRDIAKKKVMEIIKTVPEAGKNKIISAHGGIISRLGWHNSYPGESGMFIVNHKANGELEVVTEITLGILVRAMRSYLNQ